MTLTYARNAFVDIWTLLEELTTLSQPLKLAGDPPHTLAPRRLDPSVIASRRPPRFLTNQTLLKTMHAIQFSKQMYNNEGVLVKELPEMKKSNCK